MSCKIDLYRLRQTLYMAIRHYFHKMDYIEVETPICVPCPGMEVHLDYFQTEWIDHYNNKHTFFLRSSPEIHMKQVITAERPRIFQIARSFRNVGEKSQWHSPEFSMLEWYHANISFTDFMKQSIALLHDVRQYMLNIHPELDLWDIPQNPVYLSVHEAFQRFAKIELIDEDPDLARKARHLNYHSVREDDDFETAYFKILLDIIEPELNKMELVILYNFLPSQAALAKVEDGVAKRFEIYARGIELSNAFEELTDFHANQKRIAEITSKRSSLNKQHHPIDHNFQNATHHLPPCCGNALGIDRLLAILLQETSIETVVPFYHQNFVDLPPK